MRGIEPIKLLLWGCILAPMLLLAILLWHTYVENFRGLHAKVEQLTEVMELQVGGSLEMLAAVLKLADQRLAGADWTEIGESEALWREFRILKENLSQAESIFIVDPQGRMVLTTRQFPSSGFDHSGIPHFQVHRDDNRAGLFISDAFIRPVSSQPFLHLTMRRTSPDGRFNGIIGSTTNIPYFENQFAMAKLSNLNIAVALARDDGTVLAEYSSVGRRDHLLKALPQVALPANPWESENSIVWARPIEGFPLYLRYAVDKRSVVLAWLDELLSWVLLIVVLGGVLVGVCWLALKRSRTEQQAVAELKEQMRKREEAENMLHHSQRLEALGQLTGSVAHDFNNVLQIISSACYSLRRHALRAPGDERTRTSVEHIVEAVKRGSHLARQLLSFSRRQQLNPKPIDLRQEIFAVAPLIERTLRGKVKMLLVLGDDLWPVEVDPFELELALINVAANARDAMPEGGVFDIDLRNATLRGNETGEGLSGDFLALAMTDDGTGMSKEVVQRAFEPFFTTKDADHGTGLGLSHLYGFARQSGGAVTIVSRLGEGTSITLYLPRTKKIVVEAASKSAAANRVLVVDDNANGGSAKAAMLSELGYEVEMADSATAALDVLSSAASRFDVVFADVSVPGGMSGLDLKQVIASRYPGLPFVLTACCSPSALGPEARDNVVPNPCSLAELRSLVDSALAQKVA